MSKTIAQLLISEIKMEYNAEYIANTLWYQNIAQVESITLLPYLKGSAIYQTAYVSIAMWCDSEIAYSFIKRLRDSTKDTRIVHKMDYWWPVRINPNNNGAICIEPYTTTFPKSYFKKEEDEETDTNSIDAFSLNFGGQRIVIDPNKDKVIQIYRSRWMYETITSSHERIAMLKQIINKYESINKTPDSMIEECKNELEFVEDQLCSLAILRSDNVTLRDHQQDYRQQIEFSV